MITNQISMAVKIFKEKMILKNLSEMCSSIIIKYKSWKLKFQLILIILLQIECLSQIEPFSMKNLKMDEII